MKKGLWQRTGAVILCLCLLAAGLTACGSSKDAGTDQPTITPTVGGDPITGAVQVAESDTARLCLDTENHSFYVENKTTGYRWSSAPTDMDDLFIDEAMQQPMRSMVWVTYYDHVNKASYTVNAYGNCLGIDPSTEEPFGSVAYQAVDNGFMATFNFRAQNIVLPLIVTLEDDHISARVETAAVKYDKSTTTLLGIDILPYIGAVGYTNQEAYALIPDGSGALVYARNNKENADKMPYQRPVYGKDIVIADTDYDGITLPCFGISDGSNALLAVITADDEDAYINCESNGQLQPESGYGTRYTHAWASFKTMVDFKYSMVGGDRYATLVFEEGDIKAELLEVCYYVLNGDNAGYAMMATKYRDLLFGKQPEVKIEPALYMDLYASVGKVRSILGFKSAYNDVLTSTEDVLTILNDLKQKQVGSTVVRYNTWNKQECGGNSPTKMTAVSGVGDVARLVEEAKALNSLVYPAIERVLTYQSSSNPFHTLSGVARDPASRLIMDEQRYHTTSLTGQSYLLSYDKMVSNLTALLENAANKTDSLALSDVGSMLYSDYSEGFAKRPVFTAAIEEQLLAFTAENSLLLDAPNAYAAKYADEVINLPTSSSGNMTLDEDVPFLQMVYSGVTRYSGEPLNLSGSPKAAFLKMLEYGCMPCYAWIGDDASSLINTELDYLFSAGYSYWADTAAQQYQAVAEVVDKTDGSAMADHGKLAEGVYATTYGNGAKVIVNYNDTAYSLDGETVPAMGYLIHSEG